MDMNLLHAEMRKCTHTDWKRNLNPIFLFTGNGLLSVASFDPCCLYFLWLGGKTLKHISMKKFYATDKTHYRWCSTLTCHQQQGAGEGSAPAGHVWLRFLWLTRLPPEGSRGTGAPAGRRRSDRRRREEQPLPARPPLSCLPYAEQLQFALFLHLS